MDFVNFFNFVKQSVSTVQLVWVKASTGFLNFIVIDPLKILYFEGPTILGVGFWEKLPKKDICSRLTGVSATFWDKLDSFQECTELVERKFDTFIVGAFTVAYIWFTYKLVSYLLFRLFVIKPVTNEIKDEFKKIVYETLKHHEQSRINKLENR
jgi:hypothetical protein